MRILKPLPGTLPMPGHQAADNFIACWLMNNGVGTNALDASGRGHHGTLTGGATWTMGKYGPAIDLDGIDGHIVIPNHPDFSPILTPLSISIWVNMRNSQYFRFACKWDAVGGADEWFLETGFARTLLFELSNSDPFAWIGRYCNISLVGYENQWINIVATYDGGTLSSGLALYLNTVRIDNATEEYGAFAGLMNTSEVIHIGTRSGKYANGLIDKVMFFNWELSQNNINRLFVEPFYMFPESMRSEIIIAA